MERPRRLPRAQEALPARRNRSSGARCRIAGGARRLLFRIHFSAGRGRAARRTQHHRAQEQPQEARRPRQRRLEYAVRGRTAAVPLQPPGRPVGVCAGEEALIHRHPERSRPKGGEVEGPPPLIAETTE